jgi:hypothetical protein
MPGYPQILEAVKRVRTKVRWKPNSAENHLRKRKMRGHLPQEATIKDYEGIIQKLLQDKSAVVYLYWYNGVPYVTITAAVQSKHWLVMFSYDGLMESCFVVERPERYLSKPGFEEIGKLEEVDDEL